MLTYKQIIFILATKKVNKLLNGEIDLRVSGADIISQIYVLSIDKVNKDINDIFDSILQDME